MHAVFASMYRSGVVPVVMMMDEKKSVNLAQAILRGGIGVLEIAMRNPEAAACIHAVHKSCPEMIVGAGTVLTIEQAEIARQAGAAFAVSPGYDKEVVAYCQKINLPIIPGTCNSTDIQKGLKAGLRVIKFFPSEPHGGLKTIDYLAAPFPMVKFLPAGGIGFDTLEDYLLNPAVLACAGGFMARASSVEREDWETITSLCARIIVSAKKRLETCGMPTFQA